MDDPTRAPTAAERACAWGGAGLFVASLLYFLFSYDVTFVQTLEGSIGLGAITWDVLLFSIFALHHSAFARSGVRDAIQRRWPRLERSLYVWVASALLVITCAFWRPLGGDAWKIYGFPAGVLRVLHLSGIVLAVASAVAIDIWELSGLRQIINAGSSAFAPSATARSRHSLGGGGKDAANESEFRTTGPYGFVRHPIYSGWFLIVFAVPHMTMTRLVFAVVSSLYVLIAIPFEERSLLASSAGAYDRYRHKVRYRLVPGIY